MGSALRLHPLLVIFGLLVGFEVNGLVGALIALPLLAVGHATWEFFGERARLRVVGAAAARSRSRSSRSSSRPSRSRPQALDG